MSRTGQADGSGDDDTISVSYKPQGVAPVGKLKPSQSSMNIEKAMASGGRRGSVSEAGFDQELRNGNNLSLIHISEPTRPY